MTRHEARECAVQSLYQMDVGGSTALAAIAYSVEEKRPSDADLEFIRLLVEGTFQAQQELDSILEHHMEHWELDRIGKTELIVLRLGAFELLHCPDTDIAVAMDEAVELAKEYGAETSGRFVNGVLSKLVERATEVRLPS